MGLAERIDAPLAEGADPRKFWELAKEAFRLRPFSHDLFDKLARRQFRPQLSGAQWEKTRQRVIGALREHGRPSTRTTDPNHAVGRAASAILDALPHFQRWEVTPEEVVDSMGARWCADPPPQPRFLLPPGFAEGQCSAYVRLTTGIVIEDEDGTFTDMFGELLREDISKEVIRAKLDRNTRLSDVIDLLWMETRRLELRDVEFELGKLADKVLPGSAARFSPFDAPRYRAALCMQLDDRRAPAATGGVLQNWPGMVEGTGAVHVRLYLETWASVISGARVEFREFRLSSLDATVDATNDPPPDR